MIRPLNSLRRSGSGGLTSRGLTLLELMLVMVLMGVVMGFGIGVFATLDPASASGADTVRGALRSAVNSAKARRSAAVVRIDSKTRELTPRGLEVVGTWHFEGPDLRGAFGINGFSTETEMAEGYLGASVRFPRGTKARVEFGIKDDPAFEFSEGFAIECLLAPEGNFSAHAVTVGNVFGLYLLQSGAVRVWFVSADETGGPSGNVLLDSHAGQVLSGRWTRVRVAYDRKRLAISIGGVLVAEKPATEAVADLSAALMLGGGQKPYIGRIDELVLLAWEAGDPRPLPEFVEFEAGTPAEIWFDAAGHLDSGHHPEPLVLTIVQENGARESVRVGRWGTIE